MARVHGKDLNISINAVAIEDELNSVSVRFTVPEAEITSFADAWQNFLAGKKSTEIEVSGTLDPASGQGEETLMGLIGGGPVSTVVDPTGSGPDTNDPEYLCTASGLTGTLVRRLSINMPVGGVATYEATLQNSGSTTRAVS